MTINFEGVTNKPYSMVMAGCFRLQDGTELTISSDFTSFYVQEIGDEDIEKLEIDKYEPDFNVKEGELCKFEMSWKLSYIFDPDDEEGEISYYMTPHDSDMHLRIWNCLRFYFTRTLRKITMCVSQEFTRFNVSFKRKEIIFS